MSTAAIRKTVCLGVGKYGAVYAFINFADGKLSITGVEGPKTNGDATGGCGQISMSYQTASERESIKPAYPFWDAQKIAKFFDTWDRWHLSDMRPECAHQRAAGWPEMAKQEIMVYHWRLTDEALREKNAAKSAIQSLCAESAKTGNATVIPADMAAVASREWAMTTSEQLPPSDLYEAAKQSSYTTPCERKTRGWLRPDEHALGLLCKPCPVCGYKYGSAWLKEDVPQEVIDFLGSLPSVVPPVGWTSWERE